MMQPKQRRIILCLAWFAFPILASLLTMFNIKITLEIVTLLELSGGLRKTVLLAVSLVGALLVSQAIFSFLNKLSNESKLTWAGFFRQDYLYQQFSENTAYLLKLPTRFLLYGIALIWLCVFLAYLASGGK